MYGSLMSNLIRQMGYVVVATPKAEACAADLTDIVGFGVNGIEVSLGTDDFTFAPPVAWSQDFKSTGPMRYGMKNHKRILTDVNGDGLSDAVGMHEDGVWVGLNTGTGFAPAELWLKDLGVNQNWNDLKSSRFVFDINNDGFADFIGISSSRFYVYLGHGTAVKDMDDAKKNLVSLKVPEMSDWNKSRQPLILGDINNDGMTDIHISKTGKGLLKVKNGSQKIRLVAVEDALGNRSQT